MKTEDMRKLYEGLKIIFENQTPEEKETPSGDQEAGEENSQETSQETSGQEEAATQAAVKAAIRVPENESSPAEDGQRPDPGAEPSTEPASSEAAGEPETSGEPDADEASEETSSPEEEKEDFRPEEINQAVTIAEELGLPQEPVETLFSLIDRDKLVNNEGEIGKEELTNTLKLLEAIVMRKPAETPREDNYGYDPENARQSTGFGKYL
ncbi:hypothetical protein [Corynebacterium matruchotii]